MSELTSYLNWNLLKEESEDHLHSDDAMKQYKTGINNDVKVVGEGESAIYEAYIERLQVRLDKHLTAFECYVDNEMDASEFVEDIKLTRRLVADFDAYMERFIKLSTSGAKKSSGD